MLRLNPGYAVICVVGDGLRDSTGLASKIFSTIEDVNVALVSHGASAVNLTFVVKETDAADVIMKLHENSSKIRAAYVVVAYSMIFRRWREDGPMEAVPKQDVRKEIETERTQIVLQLDEWLEMPMLLLSVIWLALFVIEMTWASAHSLKRRQRYLDHIRHRFRHQILLAPDKWAYLKKNWLTVLALALPALRIFRAFRALRL